LIVSVLESYEVVRRQLLHFQGVLGPECELILVDDGSEPSLSAICNSVAKPFDFKLHCTNDRRPWTQPRGRNTGAALAQGPKLLFFDIDHIITQDIIQTCLGYQGDKLHWTRLPAILNERGKIVTERQVLLDYGMVNERPSVHANSFLIQKTLFDRLGGYDERFCGAYGGDDIDFNLRYEELCHQGWAQAEEVRGFGYVFPDPARNVLGLFHSLPRNCR
jgi:hypothetical protein